MDYKMKFAKRLIALREENNLTQQQLADKLNISRQSLSLYEKAERTINIELLAQIADFFNVSTDYLLCRTDTASMNENLQNACKVTGLSEKAVYNLNELSNEKNSVFKVVNFLLEHEEDENTDFLPNPKDGTFKATLFDYLTSLLLINLDNQNLLSTIPLNAIGILENGIITDAYNIYSNGNKKLLNIDLKSVIEEAIFQKIKNKLIDIKQLIEKEASEHGEHNTLKE